MRFIINNIMFLRLILLCIVIISTSSCTSFISSLDIAQPEEEVESAQASADMLFINGDFENALLEYEQIYETALSHEDRNAALYGLACTQMMLANSDLQLIEAIDNLLRWDANKGPAPFTENRHLLTLALRQQSYLIQQKHVALAAREKRKNNVIAYQKRKISQMSSTLKNLQNQLEELEEIDETYQEKRKPL
jgi:hypothetical protein